MFLNFYFIFGAISALVFGLGFLVLPDFTSGLFAASVLEPGEVVLARHFGAALIGYGTLFWFARGVHLSMSLRPILIAALVYNSLGFVASLMGQLSGALSALGWFIVVQSGAFALASVYFLMTHQPEKA